MWFQIDSMIDELHSAKDSGNHVLTWIHSLKPKVPDFVAKWYEENLWKGISDVVLDLIDPVSYVDEKVVNWFEQITENDQHHHSDDMVVIIFTRMYLFGYEVYVL